MSRKNHITRIMTVMLLISVMVSMAGVEGAFEIKINTVQHSSSLNGEMSASNSPPVNSVSCYPCPDIDYSGYPDACGYSNRDPYPAGNG